MEQLPAAPPASERTTRLSSHHGLYMGSVGNLLSGQEGSWPERQSQKQQSWFAMWPWPPEPSKEREAEARDLASFSPPIRLNFTSHKSNLFESIKYSSI